MATRQTIQRQQELKAKELERKEAEIKAQLQELARHKSQLNTSSSIKVRT